MAARTPAVTKALVDQGFKTTVVEHGVGLGIDVDIVQRNPQEKGFVPQPIRWRVEQTLGTLMLHRRLVRDYEINPVTAETQVYWAISGHTLAPWLHYGSLLQRVYCTFPRGDRCVAEG